MKFNDFRKEMKKDIFNWEDARCVAWQSSPEVLRLDLHNWKKRSELIMLRRGVYLFPDRPITKVEISRHLFGPAYISLEWALHSHGLIPDVPFVVTLVSPRGNRRFVTPMGEFFYHKIKQELFTGYDPDSLLAEPEKAIVDYFYFFSGRLIPEKTFWAESRFQNLEKLNFHKIHQFAHRTSVKKVSSLAYSLEEYAKA